MNFLEFLKTIKNKDFGQQYNVLCFSGDIYPLLFFKTIFDFLFEKKIIEEKPQFVEVGKKNANELFSCLQQSFLGQVRFYYLGDYSGRLDKKKEKVLQFIFSYDGPHSVSLFVDSKIKIKKSKSLLSIDLPKAIKKNDFLSFVDFLQKDYSKQKHAAISKVFNSVNALSLDEACRFVDCLDLVSTKSIGEFEQYVKLFLEPEKSLFTLSSYFFARNSKAFFSLWKEICNSYPDIFWIMYWSDQVWRAYYVVKFQRKKKPQAASKICFRLPFTFSKMHWRDYTLQELSGAHEFLYNADYALKTGSKFCFLDLFFAKHFSKSF
jgi:hypothetical protein